MRPRLEPQPPDVPWLAGQISGAILGYFPAMPVAADPAAGWTEFATTNGRVFRVTVEEVHP